MALFDLAQLDILDLTLANSLSEDEKLRLTQVYMQAFSEDLASVMSAQLTETDDEEMKKLMKDETVTEEKIMQFYTTRIPHFEAKLMLVALTFKKNFILAVYGKKIQEYEKHDEKYGLEAWKQAYQDAQNDNWNEVDRLIKIISSMGARPEETKTATLSQ